MMERPSLGFPFARSAAAQVNYSCVQIGHSILRRHRITGAVQSGNSVTHSVADATRNHPAPAGGVLIAIPVAIRALPDLCHGIVSGRLEFAL